MIGPNGAGKTTLFNLITGIHPHPHGDILRFDGQEPIVGLELRLPRIARTFQTLGCF